MTRDTRGDDLLRDADVFEVSDPVKREIRRFAASKGHGGTIPRPSAARPSDPAQCGDFGASGANDTGGTSMEGSE